MNNILLCDSVSSCRDKKAVQDSHNLSYFQLILYLELIAGELDENQGLINVVTQFTNAFFEHNWVINKLQDILTNLWRNYNDHMQKLVGSEQISPLPQLPELPELTAEVLPNLAQEASLPEPSAPPAAEEPTDDGLRSRWGRQSKELDALREQWSTAVQNKTPAPSAPPAAKADPNQERLSPRPSAPPAEEESDPRYDPDTYKDLDDKLPNEYICPITHMIMKDPVIDNNGNTYEKNAIQYWFNQGHHTSPVDNTILENRNLTPNMALKKLIQEYIEKHKDLLRQTEPAQETDQQSTTVPGPQSGALFRAPSSTPQPEPKVGSPFNCQP